MRDVLFILFLISASNAEYTVRCTNSSETSLTFEPSADKIEGRYKVEWCTRAENNVIQWELILQYLNSRKQSKCGNFIIPPKGLSHSRFELPVTINSNCTQVCLSTVLDLVFTNTCYHIQTSLRNSNKTVSNTNYYRYINDSFTKEHFTNSTASAIELSYDNGLVVLRWFLGYVPATNFSVLVWDNQTKSYSTSCNVSGVSLNEVSCTARLPPGLCYTSQLRHNAYWTVAPSLFGDITNIYYNFCQPIAGVAEASSSPVGAWRMVVGMGTVVVLVFMVWCAVRRRHIAAWQRRVRDHWLKNILMQPSEPPAPEGVILLLYARDCAAFKRAAESLGALVQRATACRVIDVYSGQSTRLWAPAPDEWLRLMLARDDTRVLVLQSPAGALLSAEIAESRAGPALAAPLLGSLVSWRRPHSGDALLSLALRQLAATPPAAPYKKHYVANINGLGADMVPGVTPYRRYTLPETVLCLLRDLAPSVDLVHGLDMKPGVDVVQGLDMKPGVDVVQGQDMKPGVEVVQGLDMKPGLEVVQGLDMKPGLEVVQGLELAPRHDLAPVFDLKRFNLEPLLEQFKEAAEAFTNHVQDHPDYLADELLFK